MGREINGAREVSHISLYFIEGRRPAMNECGTYIYCIVETHPGEPKALKFKKNHIHTVTYQNLSAFVEDKAPVDYGRLPRETLLTHLTSHQSHIEYIQSHFTPLPVKFGTWVADENDAVALLKEGYHFFRDALHQMKGKVELEVIASFHSSEEVFRDIGDSPLVKELKEKAGSGTDGPSLTDRIRLGQVVKALIEEKKSTLSKEIISCLEKHAMDFRPHALLNDMMIMNEAFLVQEDNKDGFYEEVQSLDRKYGGAVDFRCVGPLPSYSFNTIEIKELDARQIEQARALLRIDDTITISSLKEHFRIMAELHHPDSGGAAGGTFEAISSAYELLLNFCQHYPIPLSGDMAKARRVIRKFRTDQ